MSHQMKPAPHSEMAVSSYLTGRGLIAADHISPIDPYRIFSNRNRSVHPWVIFSLQLGSLFLLCILGETRVL
jgi:hypothetical protein